MALVKYAQDNFTRANENPLNASAWSLSGSGNNHLQVLSNQCVGVTLGTGNEEAYTGVTWTSDQASEITIAADIATEVRVLARASLVAETNYLGQIVGPISAATTVKLFKTIANSFTQLGTTQVVSVSVGDVFTLSAVGTTITLLQNGVALITVTDSGIASGDPGIYMSPTVATNHVAVSLWTGYGTAFSISGSAGAAGATVSWTGVASGSTTADGSGNYTIPGLAPGAYTVTPSLTGWTFSPVNSNQTVTNANITGVNFTATEQTVATPTFSPVAGTYSGPQSVTISTTTPSSLIFYTTDGSTPTTGSTPYSGPVTVSSSLTLKAIAASSGFINSAIGSAAYTISGGGSVAYSVPDCRVSYCGLVPTTNLYPNGNRVVNGTKIYDVETSNNTTIPPTDSRAAGAPVASSTYPQNSRTPGTYGPGE